MFVIERFYNPVILVSLSSYQTPVTVGGICERRATCRGAKAATSLKKKAEFLQSLLECRFATASSSGPSFFAWQRRARNEWLVMNRKGPWEGYWRQAKRRLACCLLPAFLCAHIFIKRETSGYEADFARKPVVASRDVGKVFSDLAATGVGKFCDQLKKTFSLTANLNLPWWEVILFKSINLGKIRVSNININPRKKQGLTLRNFWLPLSSLKLISLLCPIITLLLLDWFPFTCGSDLRLLASFKKISLLLGRPQDSRINTTRKNWFVGLKFSEKGNRSISFLHSRGNIFVAFVGMSSPLKKNSERETLYFSSLD